MIIQIKRNYAIIRDVADVKRIQSQSTKQSQQQRQRMSQKQIQALNILSMGTDDLREAIYRAATENPALEIVSDSRSKVRPERRVSKGSSYDSDRLQQAIENREDRTETLQSHLMHQLNLINISKDEYDLSQKLIYNLDKNGCYGSSISPDTLIDKTRPLQTKEMVKKCIDRIQRMDPVGTCCRTLEESLYVQAKISNKANPLALFILDGHLEFLSPPEPQKVLHKLVNFREQWHSKKFAPEIPLDKIKLSEELIEESIKFILTLNPRPAQGYTQDTMADFMQPDVVLSVNKIAGPVRTDDFSLGIVSGDDKCHFQIKYASGDLPELRISPEFSIDKENVAKAKNFLDILQFRESSMVLQCCAIVAAQRDFFIKGMDYLKPLTRRHISEVLGIHESTVSRLSGKKGSKYVETEFGTLPISFFFSSGIGFNNGKTGEKKISSEVIKMKMQEIIANSSGNISDLKLTELLNNKGVQIARRTVAKYRKQLGIENSYLR